MDTTRVDLNLLVTLEALLTEQNVTKAAARLHLSQPAVSAQLNRLRELFEDPLLLPARRGMTPTAKAIDLLIPLRESLEHLRQTLLTPQDFYPERASLTLTIACTDYIQAVVIIPLVLTLRQKAPGIRIAIRHLDSVHLERQLACGEVDLALASPFTVDAQLRTLHLFHESYVLIGRDNHPAFKPNMSLEEFVKLEHVIVSTSGGSFTSSIDEALETFGHKRNVVMSAASFLFIPEIVQKSDLVALIPRRLLQELKVPLAVSELTWLAEQFDVCLIWHERSHTHVGHRWLRELIVELNA